MNAPSTPFYYDPATWAVLISLLALILSQLPPIRLLVRPKKLEVDVYSRIRILHKYGNPNAAVVVSVRNTGGRNLRVCALRLLISRDGKQLITLSGENYYETPTSQTAVLLVPFSLMPGETWTHSVTFFNELERQVEKEIRANESALGKDIREKLDARPEGDKAPVVGKEDLVNFFIELFHNLFIWTPGEYVATLVVRTEPGSASFSKNYRFTLYESDTKDLERNIEDYKYGAGISYTMVTHSGISIPLAEHVG